MKAYFIILGVILGFLFPKGFAAPVLSTLCTEDLKACISSAPVTFVDGERADDQVLARRSDSNRYHRRSQSMPSKRQATGNRVFIFNPRILQWGAYDTYGYLIKSGRASGGKNYCPDVRRRCLTPRGNFRVYRKGSSGCRSSKFPLGRGGAPMPHCMFFYKGYAIHGSPDVPNYNASHGCIRVPPVDAKWLHGNFMMHGTTVIVTPY